jgi:disulfide bond formation protein DsbB
MNALTLAWFQALVGLVGSLYFSEVRHFAPCVLCWWQRVAMYPLVILLGIIVAQPLPRFKQFILPFSFVGLGIAIYQNLLYYKIIPEAIAPCTTGVSCTTKYIEYFGFITIPMLALVGFLVITILTLIARPTIRSNWHQL